MPTTSLPVLVTSAALLLAQHATAVTITLFNPNQQCMNDVILSCPDIAEGQCCYVPGRGFLSVLFQGLPTAGIPAQGVAYYDDNMGNACAGTAVDSGFGLDLCLTVGAEGANWIQPNAQKQKRGEEQQCTPVVASELGISGRKFRVFGGDVPDEVSEAMVEFWTGEEEEREVPDVFLPYEI